MVSKDSHIRRLVEKGCDLSESAWFPPILQIEPHEFLDVKLRRRLLNHNMLKLAADGMNDTLR